MTIDGTQQLPKATLLMVFIPCVRVRDIFVALDNCIVSCFCFRVETR